MKFYIKNMVCPRCIVAVSDVFNKYQATPTNVELGVVEIRAEDFSVELYDTVKSDLEGLGFELIEDKRKVLVTKIKAAIVDLVHHQQTLLKVNLSVYLSEKLNADYLVLSAAFSVEEQNTIEKFYIQQKTERVKELMSYGQLSLSEIAVKLNYSSVAHLSAQFKKEVGLTPTAFKQQLNRKPIDIF